jgi:hypothetical protein
MPFTAFFTLTFEMRNLENPFNKVSKPDAINLSFVELIPKALI